MKRFVGLFMILIGMISFTAIGATTEPAQNSKAEIVKMCDIVAQPIAVNVEFKINAPVADAAIVIPAENAAPGVANDLRTENAESVCATANNPIDVGWCGYIAEQPIKNFLGGFSPGSRHVKTTL